VTSPLEALRERQAAGGRRERPVWVRVAVIAVLLVLAAIATRSCQQDQIKVTQQEATEMAREQVDFEPRDIQIRLLRQGLDRRPVWVVSLSIPAAQTDTFKQLALVRIDAENGDIISVEQQEPTGGAVEVSEEEALEIAKGEVDFEPTQTEVRRERGEDARDPLWVVSLSTSTSDTVIVVRVDVRTGEVVRVEERAAASP
jgi:hypothetical protein